MYLKYSQSIVSILETQQLTSVREKLLLVGIQQGFPKERIKKKIKSVHVGCRDLAIGIKGIQYKSIQLRFHNNRPIIDYQQFP